MMQIVVNGSYQSILKDLHDIIKEEGSRLAYFDSSKGVIVIKRAWWAWDATVLRVIDVTQVPGGWLVKVHSFMDRNPIKWPRRMMDAELRIIEGFQQRIPSTTVPS